MDQQQGHEGLGPRPEEDPVTGWHLVRDLLRPPRAAREVLVSVVPPYQEVVQLGEHQEARRNDSKMQIRSQVPQVPDSVVLLVQVLLGAGPPKLDLGLRHPRAASGYDALVLRELHPTPLASNSGAVSCYETQRARGKPGGDQRAGVKLSASTHVLTLETWGRLHARGNQRAGVQLGTNTNAVILDPWRGHQLETEERRGSGHLQERLGGRRIVRWHWRGLLFILFWADSILLQRFALRVGEEDFWKFDGDALVVREHEPRVNPLHMRISLFFLEVLLI